MKISKFKGYKNTNPENISLDEIVEIIRKDESVKANTLKHRFFLSQGLKAEADKEKDIANTFTVAVRCEGGRKLKHVAEFTGLAFGDFDKIPSEEALQVALQKLKDDPHTLLTFVTHSGKGLRIVFPYRVEGGFDKLDLKKKAEAYRTVFHVGMNYYDKLTGLSSDRQCNDCTRVSNIVHDPEVYYNTGAEAFVFDMKDIVATSPKIGKRRRVTLKLAVEAAKTELADQGYAFEPGHHNDYVSRMCYLLNAYGVDFGEALEWVQEEFSEDYHDNLPAIVEACYKRTEEHGTRKLPKKGAVAKHSDVKKIEEFLSTQAVLRFNVVRQQAEICWHDQPDVFTLLTDRDENSMWCRMKKSGLNACLTDLRYVMLSEYAPDFDPFVAYFEALPPWDGVTDYIGELADTVHIADDQQEFALLFRKWFVGMTASWLDPNVVNHEIMVFIGSQGNFKSTFFSLLLPPELQDYFCVKTNNSVLTKDDLLTMSEFALICLDEIDNMKQSQMDQLKAMVTAPHTNERAAYARNKVRRTHIASFCGTGNNPNFLIDSLENRRWIPVEIVSIDNPRQHPFNYVGLYSQAYALWKSGYEYWLKKEEINSLNERNRKYEVTNMEEELILKYYRPTFPGCSGATFLTNTDILQRLNMDIKHLLNPSKLSNVMRRLGFQKHRSSNSRGFLVIERSAEEIRAAQILNAKKVSD